MVAGGSVTNIIGRRKGEVFHIGRNYTTLSEHRQGARFSLGVNRIQSQSGDEAERNRRRQRALWVRAAYGQSVLRLRSLSVAPLWNCPYLSHRLKRAHRQVNV